VDYIPKDWEDIIFQKLKSFYVAISTVNRNLEKERTSEGVTIKIAMNPL
jgi:hypothetical protein